LKLKRDESRVAFSAQLNRSAPVANRRGLPITILNARILLL
jgi:hypothetical protein